MSDLEKARAEFIELMSFPHTPMEAGACIESLIRAVIAERNPDWKLTVMEGKATQYRAVVERDAPHGFPLHD
jgi:hypothetical protein